MRRVARSGPVRHAGAVLCAALLLLLASARPAAAWGFTGHRLIMQRALALLPPPLKAFFDHFHDEMVLRVVDPDLWRTLGWPDDPNHFVDFGVPAYGPYPFTALPRDHDEAVRKFGAETLKKNGLLPWREAEEFDDLTHAFEDFARRGPYAPGNTVLFAAVASHYIQDAYQPFHATDNYDGKQTGNDGIHARFERDLVERYERQLRVAPAPPVPVTNARDAAFDALLSSYRLVDPILKADRAASAGRTDYDDRYYEAFFTAVRPILERRLSEAATATAGIIIGAWERAGKPALAITGARPTERVPSHK